MFPRRKPLPGQLLIKARGLPRLREPPPRPLPGAPPGMRAPAPVPDVWGPAAGAGALTVCCPGPRPCGFRSARPEPPGVPDRRPVAAAGSPLQSRAPAPRARGHPLSSPAGRSCGLSPGAPRAPGSGTPARAAARWHRARAGDSGGGGAAGGPRPHVPAGMRSARRHAAGADVFAACPPGGPAVPPDLASGCS